MRNKKRNLFFPFPPFLLVRRDFIDGIMVCLRNRVANAEWRKKIS